jgi:pimeloyl-ACP methyl ester carboxylesterase
MSGPRAATLRGMGKARLIGIGAILGYVAAGLLLWGCQNRLIFEPGAPDSGRSISFPLSKVRIPLDAPGTLNGAWVAGGTKTVLYLHGNDDTVASSESEIAPLRELGYSVLLVDYRGFGVSPGPFPTEASVYQDAEAAWNYLVRERGVDPKALYLYGHSLGGAIAVHFGYHYPSCVDRLVLVSAGGLGREVHPVLRAASLPGARQVLDVAMRPGMRRLYRRPVVRRVLRLTPENLVNLRRAERALGDAAGRASFVAAVRGVIEPAGQRGSFIEMRYLAEHVPTLLVWSERDSVIPVSHAHATQAHLPGSQLVVFPGRGHEPHRRYAAAFADAVAKFVLIS